MTNLIEKQHPLSELDKQVLDRTIHLPHPTAELYGSLKLAYDFFNEKLFGNSLPDCVLTLNHRSKRTLGYFRADGFTHKNGKVCDEIAMNPRIFHQQDSEYVLSIIVHEMAHQWKYHFGETTCRTGYHCKEWGQKMDSLGLPPSNTGLPDGKRTGYQMMHYILPNGAFAHCCKQLLAQGFSFNWAFFLKQSVVLTPDINKKETKKEKCKFVCSICGSAVWGKPSTHVLCGEHRVIMQKEKH